MPQVPCHSHGARRLPVQDEGLAAADDAAVMVAYDVLAAGCRFLIARGGRPGGGHPAIRWRMAGTTLKELDRFLALLLEACAQGERDGRSEMFPPPEADTPRRLARLGRPGAGFCREIPRLRAIGRVRHAACGDHLLMPGRRLQADLAMAVMGAGQSGRGGQHGGRVAPEMCDQSLAAIAEFYLAIADRLRLRFARSWPRG